MLTSQAKATLANAIFASKRCEKGCGKFKIFRTIVALAKDPIVRRANVDVPGFFDVAKPFYTGKLVDLCAVKCVLR